MNDLRDTERRLSDLLHDTTPEPPASIDLHALARTAMTPSHRTSRDVVRRLAAPSSPPRPSSVPSRAA